MKSITLKTIVPAALLMAGGLNTGAQSPDVEELKAKMRLMEQTLQEMKQRVAELESQKVAPPVAAPSTSQETSSPSDSTRVLFKPGPTEITGHASPIQDRGQLKSQQEAAQRPNDLTLDPQYRGYVPVPNTGVLIKFNAKPRVDLTMDDKNSGNSDRFVTATIPLKGRPEYGGDIQSDMNARGSQLSFDVRAPEMPGNFRFYYQNDFFGGGMSYRLKQLYGQFFNITAGYTFSVFEDPDVWPDTVDYEGPNSAIFARQATVRYLLPLNDHWHMNFGIQEPGSDIDQGPAGGPFSEATANNQAPDGGFNIRWEDSKVGHVQLASILRDIGARHPTLGEENVLGWGLNLSAGINVLKRDSIQAQVTYGEGIFHFANDNFSNNDAAYDESGDLTAIPYFGLMTGYTHRWNDDFRSTASFGFIDLDNEASQGPDAYHQTYYGSLNLIWQLRKRLSVGIEGLYGKREVQSGDTGDVFRTQVGLVYSFFD